MTQVPVQFTQNFQQPGDHRLLSLLQLIPGATLDRFIGSNPNVGTTQAHLSNAGGIYPWPTTSETLDIASDDAGDTAAGLGARSIVIQGLDANFLPLIEIVPMAGIGIVTTTGLFRRVNTVDILDVGTYGGSNLGNITITNTISGQLLATIEPGIGAARYGHYTVRAGKRAVVIRIVNTPEGAKNINVRAYIRPRADVIVAPFGGRVEALFYPNLGSPLVLDDIVGALVPSLTDFWVEVQTVSGNAAMSINFAVMLFD